MESLLEGIGQYLTPGKGGKDSSMSDSMVAKDANENGEIIVDKNTSSISGPSSEQEDSSNADKKKPDKKMVDAKNQNKMQKSSQNRLLLNDGDHEDCGMCNNVLSKCKPKGSVKCWFCEVVYCLNCTDFTSHAANNIVSRPDVLWTCKGCMPRLESAKLALPLDSNESSNANQEGQGIQIKVDSLKGEIDGLKEQVTNAVKGINDFSSNLERQMRAIMNETLFGDDFPEFDPSISHAQAKRIAKEQNRPGPPTLQSVIENSALEQKHAEKKEDTEKAMARCNIIIYGLDEPTESDGEKRKIETNEKLDEILTFLEVPGVAPVKMHRLGKFKAATEGEASKPRPLKIILSSLDEATTIVNSCKKLKNAPAHLKKLSVSHDLTNEERSFIREEVKKAKDLTAKSTTLDYKVVGPPWQPRIQSFKRRDQA